MATENEKERLSRREFLKGAATAGAAVAAAGMFSGALVSPAQAADVPEKWDKEADVVIVGAGGAGMVAAIEALDRKASVILLEKAAKAGGTTALSGGVIQGSGTDFQKANNIKDTPEAHYKYWMAAGEGLVNPDLVKLMADNSGPNLKWMESLGSKWISISGVSPIAYIDPALMVNRIHRTGPVGDLAGGAAHAKILEDNAKKRGATFLFDTPVTALVYDPKNGVVGVKAKSAGKEIAVRAKKAVILASGSYDWNKEMSRAFSPQQLWALETGVCRCAPGDTGDGIKMAMALGADLANMGGTISTVFPGIGNNDGMPGIWVNKYGLRFVNEYSHYAYAMRAVFQQEEHIVWTVFDEETKKKGGKNFNWSEDFSKEISDGKVKVGKSVKELAEAIKVNAEQLQATIDKWNKDVATGKDTLFGKTVGLKPINVPSFYATRITDSNLGVIGGVKINTKTQVLDVNGNVIPRLYAAGMVAGGFIGPYYPGSGTALQGTITFGRIAGKAAAEEKPWGVSA
jgi:fumarate reductase flavoprotein subunit